MKVLLANDHGGFPIRKVIIDYLNSIECEIDDLGVKEEVRVDYPDIAQSACEKFLKGGYDFGILICGTGIGISIAANKIKRIRCALVHNRYTAQKAKQHNHANFIAMGGRIEYHEPVESIIEAFINAQMQSGRHHNRIEKMSQLEC